MPIAPRTILSLGATPPSRPRTAAFTICGLARIAPAWSVAFKKLLLEKPAAA
jgi:hypothetical protein